MKQEKPLYLYTIVEQKATKDFTVVGVIDGSGSMTVCWKFLCEAWNEFIRDIPSSFCIQFDDEAILQDSPLLTKHLGENTNISKGFFELISLIKSGKLKKNVIIVFITDGVGDDRVEDYIDKLAQEFEIFHEQGFQFKFFTLATGTDFSHTIVAELKNRIHNSTLISSQMEYVLKYEIDFKLKLNQIKDEIFYNMVRIEPAVSLVPYGKKMNRLAPNQTIITNVSKIKVNDEEINLTENMTYQDIYQLANQIMLKLMEDSTRGLETVRQDAQKQLQIIEQLLKKVNDDSKESQEILNDIKETMKKIEGFAEGKQKLQSLSAIEAAKSIAKLQTIILQNTIKRQDNYKVQPVQNEKKEKAIKRLAGMKKSVKIKTIFEQIQKFFLENNNSSPQLLVKLLQEKKGGLQLQRYALEFDKECQELFDLLHICNS